MHPWTMQRWAEERHADIDRAARAGEMVHAARRCGPVGSHGVERRATRYLGELLIRTGWRLVGPDRAAGGVRTRLALRSSAGAVVDPC
jgi:hypothetical protein